MKRLLNRKGQGTTEYIVILAIVVAFCFLAFKTQIGTALGLQVTKITQQIGQAGN